MSVYRYPWPASALTAADMAALHAVREAGSPRIPITDLIAHAVRQAYGTVRSPSVVRSIETTTPIRKAA